MGSMIFAAVPCAAPTQGSALFGRDRDQRVWSGSSPVVGQGTAFARRPLAPQHQPLQRPSAPRPRIR